MVKCPACGFESEDSATWCDFCKEPFGKERNGEPPVAPKPQPAAADDIPPEFLALDAGEKIPPVPVWLRYTAWGMIALCSLGILTLLALFLTRQKGPAGG